MAWEPSSSTSRCQSHPHPVLIAAPQYVQNSLGGPYEAASDALVTPSLPAAYASPDCRNRRGQPAAVQAQAISSLFIDIAKRIKSAMDRYQNKVGWPTDGTSTITQRCAPQMVPALPNTTLDNRSRKSESCLPCGEGKQPLQSVQHTAVDRQRLRREIVPINAKRLQWLQSGRLRPEHCP
jgi:hypothetical protein